MLIDTIRESLQSVINNIDSGNSNLSEEQCAEILSMLNKMTSTSEKFYSMYQVTKKLNISRSTLNRKIRDGILPKGKKKQGFSELFYTDEDLKIAKRILENG